VENRTTRNLVAAVAALVGGFLLYVSANPGSSAATVAVSFVVGLILFVGVAWFLMRFYRSGSDVPSADEINLREWRFVRFLRYGRQSAPLFLGIRLFLGWTWLQAGIDKVTDPAWVQTGAAVQGSWQRAVAVPEAGRPPITYPAYRQFIDFMLDNGWYTVFGPMVAWGEVLVGLGLLVGALTGIAAFFGLLMNFAFLYAGTASSNPTLVIFGVIVLLGWRAAGWWGIDRFLMPLIGTPWAPGPTAVVQDEEYNEERPSRVA
jgi:thiosulfate dehydrogenase (quinone) large subunit